MTEAQALKERIEELELAFNQLWITINNKNSSFYNDSVLKSNITKVLKERAAAAKRLQQLRSESVE
jgi:hypothetical protein